MPKGYKKDGSNSGALFHRGAIPWNKGLSKETDTRINQYAKKLSLKKLGVPRGPHTQETKAKMKDAMHRRKLRDGFVHSIEARQKISASKKGKLVLSQIGDKHWNWKGGITPEQKLLRKRIESKEWRESVFKRDGWVCQICFEKGGRLQADHIKPWSRYPELRYNINNGRTLCETCHRKTDTWGGRTTHDNRRSQEQSNSVCI